MNNLNFPFALNLLPLIISQSIPMEYIYLKMNTILKWWNNSYCSHIRIACSWALASLAFLEAGIQTAISGIGLILQTIHTPITKTHSALVMSLFSHQNRGSNSIRHQRLLHQKQGFPLFNSLDHVWHLMSSLNRFPTISFSLLF